MNETLNTYCLRVMEKTILTKPLPIKCENFVCKTLRSDSSMYLLQIQQHQNVVAEDTSPPVPSDTSSSDTGNIKTPPIAKPKNITVGKISKPNPSEPYRQTSNSSPNKLLLFAALVLILAASALAYKYTSSKPEDIFLSHVEEGNQKLQNRNYNEAIASFNKALKVKLNDTTAYTNIRQKINNAKERLLIQQGDRLFRDEHLVKARTKYKEVLKINPQNAPIRQKIDYISNTLNNKKNTLLSPSRYFA